MAHADLNRFRLLAQATGDAICDWDIINDRSWLSDRWQQLYGPVDADRLDTPTWLAMLHPDDRLRIERELTEAIAGDGQHWSGEYRFRRADGRWAHILERACILRDEAGRAVRLVAAMTDLTQQKQTEEALRESKEHYRRLADSNRRLLAEVNHRVRNNLASLRSLIHMTRGEASTPQEFAEALDRRVSAMARVHSLLADAAWQDLDLRALIESVHRPLDAADARSAALKLAGPAVNVTPRQSVPLAMTLMEMIINSGKHGALSVPEGQVEVSWRVEDGALHLRWREVNGPPVTPPVKRSLGTELIEGFIRYELGGECCLGYPAAGVDHLLKIPI